MSLQMSLVFCTMLLQMATLLILVLPLPFIIRSNLINLLDKIQHSQNFKIFLIFSLVLMSLQFWDCYNRLKKFQHIDSSYGGDIGRGFVNYDRLASKFYSQRNLYLSGAILYLQMCIGTVVTIVKRLVIKEKELRDSELVEKKAEFEGVEMQKKRKDQERQETIKLKHLIELKQTDIDTLRKQLNGMQSAYDQLNAIESIKKDD